VAGEFGIGVIEAADLPVAEDDLRRPGDGSGGKQGGGEGHGVFLCVGGGVLYAFLGRVTSGTTMYKLKTLASDFLGQ